MNIVETVTDGPILIVVTTFLFSMIYCCVKYVQAAKNMTGVFF